MSWEYRVFLCCPLPPRNADVEKWLEIREYYLPETVGAIGSWSDRVTAVFGQDLGAVLDMMREALSKPVLHEETGEEVGSYETVKALISGEWIGDDG